MTLSIRAYRKLFSCNEQVTSPSLRMARWLTFFATNISVAVATAPFMVPIALLGLLVLGGAYVQVGVDR